MPTSSSRRSEGRSRSFGPRTSAEGLAAARRGAARGRRGRAAVVVQQPQPLVVGTGRGEGVEPGEDRRAEGVRSGKLSTASRPRRPGGDVVRASALPVSTASTRSGRYRLGLQTVEHSGQPAAPSWLTRRAVTVTAPHPNHGGPRRKNPGNRDGQCGSHHTARRRLRLPASSACAALARRSPPQIPNRSSFWSAYSRRSPRTSHVQADPLGLPGGAALLRKERLGIGLRAQRALLPPKLLGVSVEYVKLSHGLPPLRPVRSFAGPPLIKHVP